MPVLNIRRTYYFMDSRKEYKIYLDGEKIGTVSFGETRQFEINEGEHLLYLKANWVRSPGVLFGIKGLEIKRFIVGHSRFVRLIINTLTALAALSLISTFFKAVNYAVYAGIPVILFLFYCYTFGRHKFLSLHEI